MINLLNDVLEHPNEYRVKGERNVLVRGILRTDDMLELNTDKDSLKHFVVFYLKITTVPGDIGLSLEKAYIPVEFKEKFIEKFTSAII